MKIKATHIILGILSFWIFANPIPSPHHQVNQTPRPLNWHSSLHYRQGLQLNPQTLGRLNSSWFSLVGSLQACPTPVPQNANDIQTSTNEAKKGEAYLKVKDYARALEHFTNSLAIAPSSGAYAGLGNAYYGLKQYPQAIEAYRQVIKMVPNNPNVHLWLAMAYQQYGQAMVMGSSASKDLRPFEAAEAEAREALRYKPDYQSAYFYLGSAIYLQKRYADALAVFQQALRLKADDQESLYMMAFAFAKLGMKAEALKAYQRLAALDPQYAQTLLTELNKLTATNSPGAQPTTPPQGTAEYYLNEAYRYRDANDFPKSIESAKRSIAVKPTAEGYSALGFAYYKQGNYQEALTPYQEAVRLKPNDYSNHYWLGVTYYRVQQYPSALSSLQEALRLKADDPYNHHWIGEVYAYGLKDYTKAVAEYRETIRLKPDYDLAHNQLGLAYLSLKQYPNALTEFQEAARLNSKEPIYLQNVGIAYLRLGKKEDAMKAYTQLQRVDAAKAKELLASINEPAAKTTRMKSANPEVESAMNAAEASYEQGLKLRDEKKYPQSREAFYAAVQSYQKALKLEPTSFEAQSGLGSANLDRGSFEDAVDAFKQALSLKQDDAATYNNLGLAYLYLEKYSESVAAFKQAIQLGPGHALYLFNLGYTYADMGQNEEAQKIYKALQTVDKTYAQKFYDEKLKKTMNPAASPARPTTFANPKITLEWIPPGSFLMGSQTGRDEAQPAHRVTFNKGFFMGKYEVTQEQWQMVMGENPSFFKNCGENCPVEQVTWNEAQEFVNRLNELKDGYRYRLPSEAEWEYAYRAGTTGYFYADGDIGWHSGMGPDPGNSGGKTHPVGGKLPNAFDLYDMAGNVAEWCSDWYHENYNGAPTDGSSWLAAEVKKYRVQRGGTFYGTVVMLSADNRARALPEERSRNNGFRVAAERTSLPSNASSGGSAAEFLTQADQYAKAKEDTKAVEAYKKAIAIQPTLAKAFYGLGSIYAAQKQDQKATLLLREAIRLNPKDAQAKALLAESVSRVGADYVNSKKYSAALAPLQEAISLKPDVAEAQFNLGIAYYSLKQYENAVPALREAFRLKPQADSSNYLGVACINLKRYSEAVAAFQEALRLKPSETLFQFNLGVAYVSQGKVTEALGIYRALLVSDKMRAQSLYSEMLKQQLVGVVAVLEKEAQSKPGDPEIRYQIGTAYVESKQYPSAIAPLREALRLKPDYSDAGYQLGIAYFNLKQFPDAVDAFKQVIQLKPDYGAAHTSLGLTYVLMGKKEEALAMCEAIDRFDQTRAKNLRNYMEERTKAGQGDAKSQNSLGFRYENGLGVPQDKVEAIRWYRLAAAQKLDTAFGNLCNLYAGSLDLGKGVSFQEGQPYAPLQPAQGSMEDVTEMLSWCQKAAAQQAASAKRQLGILYAKGGPGLKPNFEEAYFWLSMAFGQDPFRDEVAKHVSEERRAEIEKKAKDWNP